MKPTILTTFDTMTQNLRGSRGWGMLHHVIIEPYKAYSRNTLSANSSTTTDILSFVHGQYNNNAVLFGVGTKNGDSSSVKIETYDDTSETWGATANGEDTSSTLNPGYEIYFEGYLYGFANSKIWRLQCTSPFTFTAAWHSQTYTHTTKPIQIGSNVYFALDNKVYELATGGSSLSLRFTLAADRYITSLASRGQALSVMTYNQNTDSSTEFLFSVGDVSITNAFDKVDWGAGKVQHHAEIHGVVVGVQNERFNQVGDTNDASIKLKRSTGGTVETTHEIRGTFATGNATLIGSYKQVFEDALFFELNYTQNNDTYTGICSFDHTGAMHYPFTSEYLTTLHAGFIIHANRWFVSYDSGTVLSTETSTGGTKYKSTAITRKIDNGDPLLKKQVNGASVYFTPMTSTTTDYVKLYYKDQDQTSWTLLNQIAGSATNEGVDRLSAVKDTNGNPLRPYKERQYKIEFVGVDLLGFRTGTPKPISDEPYTV